MEKEHAKKESQAVSDTITVPDTGYTGIKQYMSRKCSCKRSYLQKWCKGGFDEIILSDRRSTSDILVREWIKGGFSKMVLPGRTAISFNSI